MAKISNSEINALIRKLEAEIKPTEKELEDFDKTWKPNKEEKELIDLLVRYRKMQEKCNILYEALQENAAKLEVYVNYLMDSEEFLSSIKNKNKNTLFKQINTQELKDDLLLSGLSSDFNLEEWLKEAKTKYVK